MVTKKTEPDPPLNTYQKLQDEYSKTLKCPCSNIIIPYERFITVSPILHQVCSSDFIDDRWLLILQQSTNPYMPTDWRNLAASQFSLLLELCQLTNNTIDDAVHRFLLQSFITSSVLTEINLNIQLNATFNQFFQSTTAYFGFLVDTARLLLQVDQPFMGSIQNAETSFATQLIPTVAPNYTLNNMPLTQLANYPPVQVYLATSKIYLF